MTVLVAASDALAGTKATADFLCDGIADQAEIEVALAAGVAGGATVRLSEGTFHVSAPLAVGGQRVARLQGEGPGVTVLDAGVAGQDAIRVQGGHHHEIEALEIRGSYRYGVMIDGAGYCVLDSLKIVGPTTGGVRLTGENCRNVLVNLEIVESGGYGVWELGVANRIEAVHVRRSVVGGLAAFRVSGANSVYTAIAADNHTRGVWICEYARAVTLEGVYLEGCSRGLFVHADIAPPPAAIAARGVYACGCPVPVEVRSGSGIEVAGLVVENREGA